jgi:hypothetical protein
MHQHRRNRRIVTLFLAAAASLYALGHVMSAGAASPPPNTVSLLGHMPNWFHDHLPAGTAGTSADDTAQTEAFVDPANRLLFEYLTEPGVAAVSSARDCTNLVRLDFDSYAVAAVDGSGPSGSCQASVNPFTAGSSPAAVLAIDSTDRLLFVQNGGSSIAAVSEDSLARRFTFSTPATGIVHDPTGIVGATVYGISWYAPADELLVLSGIASVPGSFGVADYDAHQLVGTSGTAPPIWTAAAPACQGNLKNNFATSAAYRTSNGQFVLVPCILVNPNSPGSTELPTRDGVVSIALAQTGCPTTGHACPSTAPQAVAPAPGGLTDVYFDPGSDRMFMPTQGEAGTDLLTFEGDKGTYLGKTSLGTSADANQISFGLETSSGRLFAVGPRSGMTLLDGRVTPVSPGSVYEQYAATVYKTPLAALAPDRAHPFRRLLVPPEQNNSSPYFLVYADTSSVSQNPPPNQVDSNTYSGAIPPGSTVNNIYSGSARGYGFHEDFVGGAQAIVTNAAGGQQQFSGPFTGGTDLLGAEISQLTLQAGGSAIGNASALGDGNGATSSEYQACSALQSVAACLPPPPCPASFGSCAAVPSVPVTSPVGSQPWPFPTATCSAPGSADGESGTSNGVYGSTSQSAQPIPPTDSTNSATATVNCAAADGGITGTAVLGHAQDAAGGLPGVYVGDSSATSTVTPPGATGGLLAQTTAVARSLRIDLGQAVITIGEVVQTASATSGGTPGSARTTDAVTISHISVNGTEECSTNCAQAIAEINSEFATLIHITEQPAADDTYANHCHTNAQNPAENDCLGSPGGYQAAVQANLDEQYGDQQFNEMNEAESTYLPAMRIVLYSYEDGVPSLNREVIDLAGVEDDTSDGIQVFPGGGTSTVGTATSFLGGSACNPACQAGVPGSLGGGQPSGTYPGGLLGVIERVLSGLAWLVRSPGAALQMAAFLTMLALPIVLMRRRWRAAALEARQAT